MAESVEHKVDDFFSQFRVRKFKAGQILILDGDETKYVYHLINGRVKEYDVSYRGDEIILNIFHEPAFFPMPLAINKMPSQYIFEAETDIEFHQAPSDQVVDFIQQNPEVMYDLLARVYKGVEGIKGRMSYLMASSAQNRLMYELVLETRRFGIKQQDGSYALNLKEKDLGARVGLSRETISREIRKLKDKDLIVVTSKNLIIKNLEELQKKLGIDI